jgi:hypothetical protein
MRGKGCHRHSQGIDSPAKCLYLFSRLELLMLATIGLTSNVCVLLIDDMFHVLTILLDLIGHKNATDSTANGQDLQFPVLRIIYIESGNIHEREGDR